MSLPPPGPFPDFLLEILEQLGRPLIFGALIGAFLRFETTAGSYKGRANAPPALAAKKKTEGEIHLKYFAHKSFFAYHLSVMNCSHSHEKTARDRSY
jgi:hypothetical protein